MPIAAAGLLGLAACGTQATTGGASAAGAGTPGAADMAAFRTCMADQGVTLPEPGAGDGATPPTGTPEADGKPPDGGGPGGRGGGPGAAQAPPGVDATAWASAQAACADLLPAPPGAAAAG